MVNPHVHSSIARDHVPCELIEGIEQLGIRGKGVIVEDSFTINYCDSGVSPGSTKTFNWVN